MSNTATVEEIILDHDRRGIAALRGYLPTDFCTQAARFMLEEPGNVLIATGFYILDATAPETDGPPGALALGRALAAFGFTPIYVTDQFAAPYMEAMVEGAEVVTFPMVHHAESVYYATTVLERYIPTLVIAVERCAMTQSGRHVNMHGVDISSHTARLDYLFYQHQRTVGIGDGGNEIGMGNLAQRIPDVAGLPKEPAAVPTTHLVIASTSNWGAYGLVAAMSLLEGRDLLPAPEAEDAVVQQLVELGAVDGLEAKRQATVDTFSLEVNREILERLHQVVGERQRHDS